MLIYKGKEWSKLNSTEWSEGLDYLRNEGYRHMAKTCYEQDEQPCDCFHCKMYRQYCRIDGCKPIVRIPKPKRVPK